MVSDRELSAITGISRRTFQNWRVRRRGPPYAKAGRVVRYNLAAAIYWMRQNGLAASSPT
jgi:phage terminase Nu1 subunit (DNA packaging protein)